MQVLRYAVIVLLLSMQCVYVMDLQTVSNWAYDRFFFLRKPNLKKENIDQLPLEIQGIIVKKLFSVIVYENEDCKKWIDQKRLENHAFKIPLLLGINCVNKFRHMQNICSKPIGNKKILMQELCSLPKKEQEVFIRMAKHSSLSEGNIFADDFEIVKNMHNKDVQKGLELKVNYINNDLLYIRIKNISLFVMAFSVLCLPFIMWVDRFIPGIHSVFAVFITGSFISYLVDSAVIFCRHGFEHNYIKEVKF